MRRRFLAAFETFGAQRTVSAWIIWRTLEAISDSWGYFEQQTSHLKTYLAISAKILFLNNWSCITWPILTGAPQLTLRSTEAYQGPRDVCHGPRVSCNFHNRLLEHASYIIIAIITGTTICGILCSAPLALLLHSGGVRFPKDFPFVMRPQMQE